MNPQHHKQTAYALLRITTGLNLLAHGLVRLPKIPVFRNWMVELFRPTILPDAVTYVFATVVPPLEFTLGVLLIAGLFTRISIIAGALLMAVFIFGSCLAEQWEFAAFQMIYALFFYLLLHHITFNFYTADQLWKHRN